MRRFIELAFIFAVALFLVALGARLQAAWAEDVDDTVWKSKQVPMYINLPDKDGKDNLVVEYEVWEGFGPKVDAPGAKMIWAFVDYQRVLGGVRIDITTEKGVFPTCPVFEVNDVEYLKKLNDPRLKIYNSFMTTCEGVEKWITTELK